jgi:2-oxoglutarate ferredoxin oxidoreductase subunit alpha
LGLIASARHARRSLIFAGTSIPPANELLQRLIETPLAGVRVIQAEDESAAVGMALGAAFAGALGATATSGAGLGLMAEIIALGAMAELPLIVFDIQRGGPSVGLPTKTEQADLLQAIFGRNGECPVVVLAPDSPGDGVAIAREATRIACRYLTPVIVLADAFLARSAESWRVPDPADWPPIESPIDPTVGNAVRPYVRDSKLARPWIAPGTPGREHRIGGLEKEDGTGAVSFDPYNHEQMVSLRAAKIAGIADSIPDLVVDGPDKAELLVLSWGSTRGTIAAAVQRCRRQGKNVAQAHLRHLHPWPRNLAAVLARYPKLLVPELNGGQLLLLLRAASDINAVGFRKIQGRPFLVGEIEARIVEAMKTP